MILDQFLNKLNSRRLARLIRETPNYDQFKFAILGALLCEYPTENEFLDWIPLKVLATMGDDRFLPVTFRRIKNIDDAIAVEIDSRRRNEKSVEAFHLKAIAALRKGSDPGFQRTQVV